MDRGIGLNTKEKVVPRRILLVHIVNVVGGYHRYVQVGSKGKKPRVDLLQLRDGMSLNFQVEIIEKLFVPQRTSPRFLDTPLQDEARYLTVGTGRKSNQPVTVLGQQFPVYPWFIVETLQVSLSD
jgi:hypothetical protein